jgi:hypothetical protein
MGVTMDSNKIFLFKINKNSLRFNYRLLKISISGTKEDMLYEKLLNQTKMKIAREIWKKERNIKAERWSILTKIDGEPYTAIPGNFKQSMGPIHYPSMNRVVTFKDNQTIFQFDFDKPTDGMEDLALKWLDDNLRITMERHKEQLWNIRRTYYYRTPVNIKDHNRKTEVYKGFSLKIYRRNNGYALCVSDSIKYVDSHSLEWHIQRGENINSNSIRNGIYKNGLNWYEIKILGKTTSIKNQLIPGFQGSLYDYIKNVSKNRKDIRSINPGSPAFEYQYPNDSKTKHFANTAWAHFTYSTNDQQIKRLHSKSIKSPDDRLYKVQQFVRCFLSKDSRLSINTGCESVRKKWFPLPPIRFGKNSILAVKGPNKKDGVNYSAWFASKKNFLCTHGIYKKGDFLPQYLVVPNSMPQSIIDTFRSNICDNIESLTGIHYRFSLIIQYHLPQGPPSLSNYFGSIKQAIKEHRLMEDRDATIVLVLPANAPSKLHDHLKILFKDGIRSQFLMESYADNNSSLGICDFFERCNGYEKRLKNSLERRYHSYVFNVALGVLLANRKWLYRLDKRLHYDLTIGMDISGKKVGMTLYDGEHGELIFKYDFNAAVVRVDQYRREKLPVYIMKKTIDKLLGESISKLKLNPKSVIIQRDGRAFDSEWIGFQESIKGLQNEGRLPKEMDYGIIEVYKSSVSMPRLVGSMNGTILNPLIGSYEFLNDQEAILITTGLPAKIRGTAQPLLIRKRFGNINLMYAIQDAFDLSNLCYAAPDKPQSLPITLKMVNDFLTPIAYDITTPGYDEEEETKEEFFNKVIRMVS